MLEERERASRQLEDLNKVERLSAFLKQWRRIATRYEKRASNYMAMLTLGVIVLWL
jgi:transposase